MSTSVADSSTASKYFVLAEGALPEGIQAAKDAVEAEPYNEALVGQLEAAVEEQVKSKHYCLEVNLGLLKLYKTYPSALKEDTVAFILAKALMALPGPDFSLCLALVPKKMLVPSKDSTDAATKNIASLMVAASQLELATWADFWASVDKNECELLSEAKIPGVLSAVRGFVVSVLNISFEEVPLSVLEAALHMKGKELDAVLEKEGYTKGEGDLFKIPANSENQMRPKKFKENISLQHMTGVIKILSK